MDVLDMLVKEMQPEEKTDLLFSIVLGKAWKLSNLIFWENTEGDLLLAGLSKSGALSRRTVKGLMNYTGRKIRNEA